MQDTHSCWGCVRYMISPYASLLWDAAEIIVREIVNEETVICSNWVWSQLSVGG